MAKRESIGERLHRLRTERGLSQRELSSPGVSYAYIGRLEADERTECRDTGVRLVQCTEAGRSIWPTRAITAQALGKSADHGHVWVSAADRESFPHSVQLVVVDE
jgi:transcriptional regulator with XRE-family HTH domain